MGYQGATYININLLKLIKKKTNINSSKTKNDEITFHNNGTFDDWIHLYIHTIYSYDYLFNNVLFTLNTLGFHTFGAACRASDF